MCGKLVSKVSVPFDSLKTSTLLPHPPEELASLTVTFRVGALVPIGKQPLCKPSLIIHLFHIVLDKEARNEQKGISIVILLVHCKLTLLVEESRITFACALEYFKVVLLISNTTRNRRNHTLRIVLWRFLPICHLRIVSAVKVTTTDGIKVLEGRNSKCRASDSSDTICNLKIVRRVLIRRKLQFCTIAADCPPRLILQSLSVHRLDFLSGVLLLGEYNGIPSVTPKVLKPLDVKLC